jgi:hypothetical protein
MTRTFSIVLCLLFLFCTQKQAFSEEDGNFNKQLMDVENEVNDLKERFFKSKATLRLLKESIVQGAVQGAKAKVRVRNKLGSGYVLDGNIQFSIDGIDFPTQGGDDVMLSEQKEYEILDKEITPGQHSIEVKVSLRGNGSGLFSYINKYSFTVNRVGAFIAKQGDECQLIIELYEKKGFGLSFLDKPQISFEPRCRPISGTEF